MRLYQIPKDSVVIIDGEKYIYDGNDGMFSKLFPYNKEKKIENMQFVSYFLEVDKKDDKYIVKDK